MMAAGVETVESAIHHVRNPGQGMPIAGMPGRESPDQRLGCHAALHLRVPGHVIRVVVIRELVADYGAINEENTQNQAQAEQPQPMLVFGTLHESTLFPCQKTACG